MRFDDYIKELRRDRFRKRTVLEKIIQEEVYREWLERQQKKESDKK